MHNNEDIVCLNCVISDSMFLHVMQLFSANFPLGNFHYSSGLEWAVESGWVNSVDKFIIWEKEFINNQLLYLDFPMLQRFYFCFKNHDIDRLLYYVNELLSFRETCELRMEEQERGEIMVDLLLQWNFSLSSSWQCVLKKSVIASIAWVCFIWNIPVKILGLGYAYSSIENHVMVGLKLVPFGQIVAQKLLIMLVELLPVVWEKSCSISDKEFGSSFPLQEIASSCHETQYSRIFRS